MTELLWLAAFAAASYGAGSLALRLAKLRFSSFGEEALLSQVTGFAAFATATLLLGLAGMLSSWLFKAAIITIAILSAKKLKRLGLHLHTIARSAKLRKPRFCQWVIVFLAGMAVLNLLAALAPVHSSDAAAYHVATPKLYAEAGKIFHVPFMVTSSYPMVTEMLFLDGMLLDGGKLSELIAAYMAIIAAVAVYIFTRRHFGFEPAVIAASLFYTLPLVSVYNVRGFVDISAALYGMAALIALFSWHQSGQRKMLFLGGVLAGAAAATKISAYPIPAVLMLLVIYAAAIVKKHRISSVAKDAAVYATAAAAVVFPWLARAYYYTGNPFYPLFHGVFGGPYLPEGLAAFWVESLSFIGSGTGIWDLLLVPWNLTMHSPQFGEMIVLGPGFLAFIPALLMRKMERKTVAVLAVAVPLMLAWFYTAQSPRYIFLVYALLAVAAGHAASRLAIGRYRAAVLGVVAATLILHGVLWAGANHDELGVVAGITDEDEFLSSKMGNYGLLQYANSNLKDAKLCLYGEIRGYYSDNDYVWCHPLFQAYIDFYTIEKSEEILQRMKEAGITHLVVENDIETFAHYSPVPQSAAITSNADKIITDITANSAREIFENEKGAVYEIRHS